MGGRLLAVAWPDRLQERAWYGSQSSMPRIVTACFGAEHDMMWEIARLSGVQEKDPAGNLGDPAVRHQIADEMLEACERDVKAAERIERVLAQWQ